MKSLKAPDSQIPTPSFEEASTYFKYLDLKLENDFFCSRLGPQNQKLRLLEDRLSLVQEVYQLGDKDRFDSLDELWAAWKDAQVIFEHNQKAAESLADSSVHWTTEEYEAIDVWLKEKGAFGQGAQWQAALSKGKSRWPWTALTTDSLGKLELPIKKSSHENKVPVYPTWKDKALITGHFDFSRPHLFSKALHCLIQEALKKYLENTLPAAEKIDRNPNRL